MSFLFQNNSAKSLASGFFSAVIACVGLSVYTASAVTISGGSTPISSVISTGSTATYTEEEPNLWFLLDDSGSMGRVCPAGNRCSRFFTYGFIGYDPSAQYVLPKRVNGTDMPMPSMPSNRENMSLYSHPFIDDALGTRFASTNVINKRRVKECHVERVWNGWYWYNRTVCEWVTKWNRYTDIGDACWQYKNDPSNADNCLIWLNYYSSRMRVLKSALSLSFFSKELEDKTKRLRVGYMSLNDNSSYYYYIDGQTLPVMPLDHADGENNRKAFNRWLYAMKSNDGTPLRGRMSELYSDIIAASVSSRDRNNPFLKVPGESYDSVTNPVQACRRNYAVILTDGEWNQTANYLVDDNLKAVSHIKNNTTEESQTLPDGIDYRPVSPYIKNRLGTDRYGLPIRTLADIAFAGWKTDMDNDSANNDVSSKHAKVNGVVQELHGSSYWHPYNDEASWQHINTFTIGFGLPGNASVNPPENGVGGLDPAYVASRNTKWDINISSSSSITSGDNTVKDLANAALASRGRFYNARTADDLKAAFNDIVKTTSEGGEQPGIKGSAGAIGVAQQSGSAHYGTFYDVNAFTGELVRTAIYTGDKTDDGLRKCFNPVPAVPVFGELCTNKATSRIEASQKLMANISRRIVSAKRSADTTGEWEQINFAQNEMNDSMKHRLSLGFPPALDSLSDTPTAKLNKLIEYVKGSADDEGQDKFRVRNIMTDDGKKRNILGAIMRTSPVIAGVPRVSSLHPYRHSRDYLQFLNRYLYDNDGNSRCSTNVIGCSGAPIGKDFVDMVYAGSNDGMLHAFRADTLDEVFAYVPNAVYDKLPNIVEPNAQQLLVDGGLSIQTINIAKSGTSDAFDWKQLLVGALGAGGKGLYALDVTNPQSADIAAWEYSDLESRMYQKANSPDASANVDSFESNVGNIIAKPATVQLSDGTWAVLVGNGYNSESGKATLIAINADTGKAIQELVIDNNYTDNDLPNGLGPLYFIAYPHADKMNGNHVDRAYAGDLQGNLWVFDLTHADKDGNISIAKAHKEDVTAEDKPLFVAKYQDSDTGKTIRQPITVAPLVQRHPSKYGYLVHFGTGSLFTQHDQSSKIKNSIYAIWDDWISPDHEGLPSASQRINKFMVKRDHLKDVEFYDINGQLVTTANGLEKRVRILKSVIEGNTTAINWAYGNTGVYTQAKRGWYIDLLVGERAWQSPNRSFGDNNVEGISYVTERYQTDSDDTAGNCSTKGSGVVTWSMSFNPRDGGMPLANSGTLDVDDDGVSSKSDLVPVLVTLEDGTKKRVLVPASGVQTPNEIILSSEAKVFAGFGTKTVTEPYCNYRVAYKERVSSEGVSVTSTCRRSYSGSWNELK